eukprot:10087286-Alexandrium_andersonii.AAC.1
MVYSGSAMHSCSSSCVRARGDSNQRFACASSSLHRARSASTPCHIVGELAKSLASCGPRAAPGKSCDRVAY